MKPPFVVKVIKVLAWLSLLIALQFIGFIIWADNVRTPTSDVARGIRDGGLKALGLPYNVSTYEAAKVAVNFTIPAILLILFLLSISKRQLLLFRITATILLLLGMTYKAVPIIIIGVLAWLPSVTRYFKSGEAGATA